MILALNHIQILKLSDLCMDLAKGLLLSSIVTPLFSSIITTLVVLRSIAVGFGFIYISLKLLELKKENK